MTAFRTLTVLAMCGLLAAMTKAASAQQTKADTEPSKMEQFVIKAQSAHGPLCDTKEQVLRFDEFARGDEPAEVNVAKVNEALHDKTACVAGPFYFVRAEPNDFDLRGDQKVEIKRLLIIGIVNPDGSLTVYVPSVIQFAPFRVDTDKG